MNKSISFKSMFGMLLCIMLLASCSTPKNIAYLQGIDNAQIIEIAAAKNGTIKIQPFDKLSIIVTCTDPSLTQMFNLPVLSNNHVQRNSPIGPSVDFRSYNVAYSEGISGFTVSADGTIQYPVLGQIKVEGMTRNELAAFIKGEIMGRGLIKDPIVTVEFLNVGISVMGEVNRPGRYDLNVDEISLLEAISLAGDLTIQGQRENVKVLRKEGDSVQTFVIDLTDSKNMLSSPAYYLKQGDIIYVEPNSMRKRSTVANGNNVTNVSFWLSVASLLTSAAILFKK